MADFELEVPECTFYLRGLSLEQDHVGADNLISATLTPAGARRLASALVAAADRAEREANAARVERESVPCSRVDGHVVIRSGPRMPLRYGSAVTEVCACGAWRVNLHGPGPWRGDDIIAATTREEDE